MTTHGAKTEARQAFLARGHQASADDITLGAIILTLRRLTQDDAEVRQMMGMVEALLGSPILDNLEQHLECVVQLANHGAP